MASPQVVVITGGTQGVGRATARRFARAGARVGVLARGPDALAATRDELTALGAARVHTVSCDVADHDQVEAAANAMEAELGPIDIWINNAMTTVFARFLDVTPAEFRRVLDVTLGGYVWGTRAALERMRPRNRGLILQVGSALAYRSIPLQSAYCAAKHAIVGFTDSLRSELLRDRIDVDLVVVHLPAVNTPQFRHCLNRMPREPQPVPPIFQPEVIADAIFTAARHRRREVYLGWPTVKAIFGQELVPGYADRVLAAHGFESQMTEQPARPRPTNLWKPVEGDPGAHGDFDARSRGRDPIARATTWLGAAGVRAIAGLAGAAAVMAIAGTVRAVAGARGPRRAESRSRRWSRSRPRARDLLLEHDRRSRSRSM